MRELHRCTRKFETASGRQYTADFRIVIEENPDGPETVVRKEREDVDGWGWDVIEAYVVTSRGLRRDYSQEATA